MLKIVVNHNKLDVTYSFKDGRTFPEVEGKLISVELSGKELHKYLEKIDVPICEVDNAHIIWHNKHAGRVLKTLREIYA